VIFRKVLFGVAVFLFIGELTARAQQLLNPINIDHSRNSSGERPLRTSKESFVLGYSPAHGADEVPITWPGNEIHGPDNVGHRTISLGRQILLLAFHTSRWWEPKRRTWLVNPRKELLADFTRVQIPSWAV